MAHPTTLFLSQSKTGKCTKGLAAAEPTFQQKAIHAFSELRKPASVQALSLSRTRRSFRTLHLQGRHSCMNYTNVVTSLDSKAYG